MVEIWNAANATKSDIIGLWWKPDAVATELQGSGFELAQVIFKRLMHDVNVPELPWYVMTCIVFFPTTSTGFDARQYSRMSSQSN